MALGRAGALAGIGVRATGADLDAAGLTEWSGELLGRHTYPRRVEVTDALPLGPRMKALKRELRTRHA
ncbi:hypothetical protein GCM10020295_71570 [Streptomyces cinereospinus]